MKRLYNFFRLLRLFYTRNLMKELLLSAEVCLMMLLLVFSLVPVMNHLLIIRKLETSFTDRDKLIYFSRALGMDEDIDLYKLGEQIGTNTLVYHTSHYRLRTGTDTQANLIVISKELSDIIRLDLLQGQLENKTDTLSIVISQSLLEQFPVGSRFATTINGVDMVCEVTGVLSESSAIISISGTGASFPTIEGIGFQLAYYERMEKDFMIAIENHDIALPREGIAALYYNPTIENVEQYVEKLNTQYWEKGRFFTYRDLKKNFIKEMLDQYSMEMFMTFLLVIIVLINFFGYLIISTYQNQHLISILNICGLSYKRAIRYHIASIGTVIMMGFFAGIGVTPKLISWMNINFYSFNYLYYICFAAVLIVLGSLGVVAAIAVTKNMSISYQYKVS